MQGLESLSQFQKFVSSLGGLGRFEDTYMIHAAEGETVVPMEVLDRNPVLKKRLFKSMKALGIDPGRYIVGNDLNSLNPLTGQPEFFFKKIIKRIKKGIADVSGYAAPIIGAMYGPWAGAAAGAAMGAFKRENPGDPSQWAQMGVLGGLSGLAANLASGQKMFSGTGARGIYTGTDAAGNITKTWNPVELGRRFMGDPGKMWDPDLSKSTGFGEKETIDEKTSSQIRSQIIKDNPGIDTATAEFNTMLKHELGNLSGAKSAVKSGMDVMEAAKLYGLSSIALRALIDSTTSDQDVGPHIEPYKPHGLSYENILNPKLTYGQPSVVMAEGGVLDLQGGGESKGPGTGTSDSIPAMLSDGEFVMTADAVRGAGGGDRREGAKKMYEAMDRLEARA